MAQGNALGPHRPISASIRTHALPGDNVPPIADPLEDEDRDAASGPFCVLVVLKPGRVGLAAQPRLILTLDAVGRDRRRAPRQ